MNQTNFFITPLNSCFSSVSTTSRFVVVFWNSHIINNYEYTACSLTDTKSFYLVKISLHILSIQPKDFRMKTLNCLYLKELLSYFFKQLCSSPIWEFSHYTPSTWTLNRYSVITRPFFQEEPMTVGGRIKAFRHRLYSTKEVARWGEISFKIISFYSILGEFNTTWE